MRMSLAEMCRLVAYYGDISEENRRRWFKYKGQHPVSALLRDNEPDERPEGPK